MAYLKVLVCLLAFLVAAHGADLPAGFKRQELAPLGGELIMPESWIFRGGMTATGFTFTASEDLAPNGSYQIGYRIQGIAEVKERSNTTPQQAVEINRDRLSKIAKRVIKSCDEQSSPPFRKTCLEVVTANPADSKDDFHVIYSFFWNDEMDLMVTTVFGAPESRWEELQPAYQVMREFKLLGAKKAETTKEGTR